MFVVIVVVASSTHRNIPGFQGLEGLRGFPFYVGLNEVDKGETKANVAGHVAVGVLLRPGGVFQQPRSRPQKRLRVRKGVVSC